jgi:DNA-binding transcriptional LysR family regulator
MRITHLRQADLNLLVVFTVLSEERHISRAAARLLLSQPAVSRALQRLRDMFHDDLLVRTAAGYEHTPQGLRLMHELETMLPRLDQLLSGSSFDPSVEKATFRIAATDNASTLLAPLLCREVMPLARKVRVDFTVFRPEVFEDLAHGRADLVLSAKNVEFPWPLVTETIFEEEFVCAVAAESAYKKRLTIEQYMAAEHISISIQGGVQTIPDKPLAAQGYRRRVAMSVPYFHAAMRSVVGTRLIATVPRRLALGEMHQPGIRLVAPPVEVAPFGYAMTWHPRVNTDAAHVWLRETVRGMGKRL